MLDCGHPAECEYEVEGELFDEGEPPKSCQWCQDIASFRRKIIELERCVDKQSLTVHSGTVTLTGDVGLVRMYGGMFNVKEPGGHLPHTVLDAGSDKV